MHKLNILKKLRTTIPLAVIIPILLPQAVNATPITIADLQLEHSSKYLGIHMGTKDSGADVFSVGSDGGEAGSNNRSALGRINATNDLPATEPGVVGPSTSSGGQTLPGGSDTPISSFGGNIALLEADTQIEFSDTDTYAADNSNLASFGIECANSNCVKDNSNANFFTPSGDNPDNVLPIGTNQGTIDSGNGVTENVNFDDLKSDILGMKALLANLSNTDYTGVLDLTDGEDGSDGYIDNRNAGSSHDFIVGDNLDSGTMVSGLNIINIVTGGNDFNLNNSNFIVNGDENSTFIFVVEAFEDMLVTNSRILAGENMGLNNILFAVQGDTTDTHFNFSQSEVWGISFWDMSMYEQQWSGNIVANNLRGCGQWVSNALKDWNDVSVDRCAFGPSTPPSNIPEPAALILMALGLFTFGLRREINS